MNVMKTGGLSIGIKGGAIHTGTGERKCGAGRPPSHQRKGWRVDWERTGNKQPGIPAGEFGDGRETREGAAPPAESRAMVPNDPNPEGRWFRPDGKDIRRVGTGPDDRNFCKASFSAPWGQKDARVLTPRRSRRGRSMRTLGTASCGGVPGKWNPGEDHLAGNRALTAPLTIRREVDPRAGGSAQARAVVCPPGDKTLAFGPGTSGVVYFEATAPVCCGFNKNWVF